MYSASGDQCLETIALAKANAHQLRVSESHAGRNAWNFTSRQDAERDQEANQDDRRDPADSDLQVEVRGGGYLA